MNRERREQYEQGDMGYSGHSVFESGETLRRRAKKLQGTLPSLFAFFAPFAVRIYSGHSGLET